LYPKKRDLKKKNHNLIVSLPNRMIQIASGVQLDGAQFCFGYQDQTNNTQGAKRLQSLKCLVIGIFTLIFKGFWPLGNRSIFI
jgi:hypothetical protein